MEALANKVIVVPLEKISVEQDPCRIEEKKPEATITQKALLTAAIGTVVIAGWLICRAIRLAKAT